MRCSSSAAITLTDEVEEDTALAPNTEDCTPAPNTKGCTPAAGTEGCTPAANAEDCTPAANAEDCTPAADAEGNALAAGTEDCTLRVEGSVAGACAEGSAPMANVAGGSADMQPLVKKQKIKKQSVDRKPLKMEYKFVLSEVCEQTIKHLQQAAGVASDEDSLVEHELDLSNDAEIVAEQDGGAACTEMADAGHDIEVSSAGGEVISACSAAPDKPSKAAPSIVHLDPPKNLAKAGYVAYRWRAGMSSL